MKVIAILDMIEMPTVCKECRFREGALQGDDLVWICHLNDEYVGLNTKDDYCPLRHLPHKKMPKQGEAFPQDMRLIDRWRGWDACIDEIMGETE